jgi:hypothetical protein
LSNICCTRISISSLVHQQDITFVRYAVTTLSTADLTASIAGAESSYDKLVSLAQVMQDQVSQSASDALTTVQQAVTSTATKNFATITSQLNDADTLAFTSANAITALYSQAIASRATISGQINNEAIVLPQWQANIQNSLATTRVNVMLGLVDDGAERTRMGIEEANYIASLTASTQPLISAYLSTETSRAIVEDAMLTTQVSAAIVASNTDITIALTNEISRASSAAVVILTTASPALAIQTGSNDDQIW